MPDEGAARRRPADGRRGLPPVRKSLGQHFLSDRRILGRIADALALTGQETVIEVGAGRGALTDLLASRARRVIAIEYDRRLAPLLRERFAAAPAVSVLEADVLDVDLGALAGGPYVLAGNVPYYITTPILFHALAVPRPDRAVYLVQREVAERVVAAPGTKAYGALSANVQAIARAELLFRVPAGAFHPPPKVESAVIRVTPRADPVVGLEEEEAFHAFVKAAFGMRRKQMVRVVRELFHLSAAAAEEMLARARVERALRVESLGPEELARVLRSVPRAPNA